MMVLLNIKAHPVNRGMVAFTRLASRTTKTFALTFSGGGGCFGGRDSAQCRCVEVHLQTPRCFAFERKALQNESTLNACPLLYIHIVFAHCASCFHAVFSACCCFFCVINCTNLGFLSLS